MTHLTVRAPGTAGRARGASRTVEGRHATTSTREEGTTITATSTTPTTDRPSTDGRETEGLGTDDVVLRLDDVHLRRNGTDILAAVDLEVRAGEHWAFLGANGAGKSSILSLCGANAHPTSGTVSVLGHRLGRIDVQTLRRMIGHVNPRHNLTSPLTVEQVVHTGLTGSADLPRRWEPSADEVARTHDLLATVGMSDRAGDRWQTLSQGQRGRVLIARALVGRPRLLLLDEPATGLDLAARELLLRVLDEVAATSAGTATVLVTHHLEELPRSTSHAALVRDGTVVAAGPIDEVLTSAHVSDAFRHPIEVHRTHGRWSATSATPPSE